jgi:hypothetical protein
MDLQLCIVLRNSVCVVFVLVFNKIVLEEIAITPLSDSNFLLEFKAYSASTE